MRDTGLGEPGVRRSEVAGAGELVAGDVVLGDEHRPRSELLGDRHTDRTADRVEDDDGPLGRHGGDPGTDIGDVEHRGIVIGVVRVRSGDRTGALHDHDPRRRIWPASRCQVTPSVTATPSRSSSRTYQSTSGPCGPANRATPPSCVVALDDGHVVAADRRDPGGLEAGRAATDHHDRAGRARRLVPVGILGLATARRFADARHDRVARIAHLTRLVASGARPDAIDLVPRQLRHEVGVGDLGAGHLHAVAEQPGRRSHRVPTRPGRCRRSTPGGSPGRRPPRAPRGTRRC